jgi:death-on-curing protein
LRSADATFGGAYLHEDLFAMAAAYLFHIASNHPLNDVNKITDLVATLSFLGINRHPINAPSSAQLSMT